MIVGGVIFLVAFMGCCGAWKESKCLIYTYAFFLAIILVAQVKKKTIFIIQEHRNIQ